jgi:hypothetical protein
MTAPEASFNVPEIVLEPLWPIANAARNKAANPKRVVKLPLNVLPSFRTESLGNFIATDHEVKEEV